jgi:hypothetical protein
LLRHRWQFDPAVVTYADKGKPRGDIAMAVRPQTKTITKKADPEESPPEQLGQKRRPEKGPFRLQVDRQTKDSFATFEEAEAAGLAIKKRHPVVQVSVYDTVKSENKIIELPAPEKS